MTWQFEHSWDLSVLHFPYIYSRHRNLHALMYLSVLKKSHLFGIFPGGLTLVFCPNVANIFNFYQIP